MTTDEAIAVIQTGSGWIGDGNSDDKSDVTLDGVFTIEQLKAIIRLMENDPTW